MRRGSFVVVLCCGSYEAYFAELEPQYAYERSEYAIHVGSHVSRYEIQLYGLAPRKLHDLQK